MLEVMRRGCWALWGAALMAATAASDARADCSRAMQVPVALLGLSVTLSDEGFGGVYPDILRAALPGCSFLFSVVPRARQQALFEAGRADLLLPASKSARRDEWGHFVPLVQARAVLISLNQEPPRAPLRSLRDLRERKELRVAVVRGFDYGEPYQALTQELRAQERLAQDADVVAVARMLSAGMADLTIMAPSILIGALHKEPKLRAMLDRLRIEPVDELPWVDSGVYISRGTVGEADRQALTAALEKAARSGLAWKTFLRYYPAGSLAESIRPRRD